MKLGSYMAKKFYLTTPLYYSNDRAHVGSAYTTIACDVLARWYRAKGDKVYFQTGLDEHGAKMAKAAEIAGFKDPKEFCDRQVQFFKKAWQDLNITYDYFIRTTDKGHQEFVQKFLEKLWKKGTIYKGKYEGLYCLGCEEFKLPSDLILGKCPLHNSKPQKIREENYFFKLSKYQKKLVKLLESDELKIEPQERKNEVLGFLKKEKLEDLSISREKVEWGIPIPWDKKQTTYCWVDALLNYLSGGERYWPVDLHLIGKDILKFHGIIWPSLLLASGYPLPLKIFAHGFFTLEGKKISKTFGNIIYAEDLIKKYGADTVRYTLLREIPFGQDGDFEEETFVKRYKDDLANDLGNLVLRTVNLAKKIKLKGRISQTKIPSLKIGDLIQNLKFKEALEEIFKQVKNANYYIDKQQPWKLNSTDKKFIKILENLKLRIWTISEALAPFLPETSTKIQNQLKTLEIKPLFPKI